jgi:hypothetical protein
MAPRPGRIDPLAVLIAIPACARLLPKLARGHALRRYGKRREHRLAVEQAVDRLHHAVLDVDADHVGERERSEAEAGCAGEDAVDVGHTGDILGKQALRLGYEGAADVIDQERRAVGAQHRLARHAPADSHHGIARPVRGLEARDDLDQPHQRNRIEEMHAGDALGVLAGGGNRRDRDGGGVGGQYRVGTSHCLELAEQGLLGIEALDDGLDDQVGLADLGEVAGDGDARERSVGLALRQAALLDLAAQHPGNVVPGRLRGTRLLVVGDDAHAALRRHLHDAAAHRAGADHADGEVRGIGVEGHGRVASWRAVSGWGSIDRQN